MRIKKLILKIMCINLILLISCSTNKPLTGYMDTGMLITSPVRLQAAGNIISTFKTSFANGRQGRVTNITLSAKSINGWIIQPNHVFSYNTAVGPSTQERGYQLATVFVNDQEIQGYGGGICQTSSTLYNAALEAGLTIVERHPHTKEVFYVPQGKDAATSYGCIDLKIQNNRKYPIMICSYINGEEVVVELKRA